MALPTRKAGGLYGGIRFSTTSNSATIVEPAVLFTPPEEDIPKKEDDSMIADSKPGAIAAADSSSANKSTAGIPIFSQTARHDTVLLNDTIILHARLR